MIRTWVKSERRTLAMIDATGISSILLYWLLFIYLFYFNLTQFKIKKIKRERLEKKELISQIGICWRRKKLHYFSKTETFDQHTPLLLVSKTKKCLFFRLYQTWVNFTKTISFQIITHPILLFFLFFFFFELK